MTRPLKAITAALFFFIVMQAGIAGAGKVEVEFSRKGDLKVKKRKEPAALTTLGREELLAQDYLFLGDMTLTQQVKVCRSQYDESTGNTYDVKCEDIEQKSDATALLLEKAAGKGADLVKLLEDRAPGEETTYDEKCIGTIQQSFQEYYCPPVGGAPCYTRTVQRTVCSKWKKTPNGAIVTRTSRGSLYRLDPELVKPEKYIHAAHQGDLEGVLALLDEGVKLKATNIQGWTALGAAAGPGHVNVMRKLLELGFPVDERDENGKTPLMVAAGGSSVAAVDLLLEQGADIDARNKGKGGTSRYTPLMFAIRFGTTATVKRLLAAGPDMKVKNGDKQTAMELAASITQDESVFATSEKYSLLWAYTKGASGYVDLKGNLVIWPQYPDARSFSEGLAAVQVGTAWGFIDREGVMVIEPQFNSQQWTTYPGPFSEGLAPFPGEKKWGFIDKTGRMVIAPQFGDSTSGSSMFSKARPFSGGMAVVSESIAHHNYVDRKGNLLFENMVQDAGPFSGGLAAVKPAAGTFGMDAKALAGYIDTTGRFVIEPAFEKAKDFSEGLAAVKVDGRWGYIDRSGTMVIPAQFEDRGGFDPPHPFSQGLAAVIEGDDWGFIDRGGRWVVKPKYGLVGDFHDGRARVQYRKKFGFLDLKGNEIIPVELEYAEDFGDGLAPFKKDGKYGYIDTTGAVVIEPIYNRAWPFSEGRGRVRITRNEMADLRITDR